MRNIKSMKIFLAGSFHTKEDENKLEEIYKLLKNNRYEVWWAPKRVQRGYESGNLDLLGKINKTEEYAIENSDLFVAVMKKATFGTAMEIKHAFDHGVPVIGYLLSEHPDFSSGSFRYRVREIVKNNDELLKTVRKYERHRSE